MNIKELLKKDFDVDLPIRGGNGNSIESAIIIEKQSPVNDYTGVEYYILKLIGIGRNVEWKTIQQNLMHFEGRKIDQIKIQTKLKTKSEIITQTENYYFDITECMD